MMSSDFGQLVTPRGSALPRRALPVAQPPPILGQRSPRGVLSSIAAMADGGLPEERRDPYKYFRRVSNLGDMISKGQQTSPDAPDEFDQAILRDRARATYLNALKRRIGLGMADGGRVPYRKDSDAFRYRDMRRDPLGGVIVEDTEREKWKRAGEDIWEGVPQALHGFTRGLIDLANPLSIPGDVADMMHMAREFGVSDAKPYDWMEHYPNAEQFMESYYLGSPEHRGNDYFDAGHLAGTAAGMVPLPFLAWKGLKRLPGALRKVGAAGRGALEKTGRGLRTLQRSLELEG